MVHNQTEMVHVLLVLTPYYFAGEWFISKEMQIKMETIGPANLLLPWSNSNAAKSKTIECCERNRSAHSMLPSEKMNCNMIASYMCMCKERTTMKRR